jgi:uncharacterized membrane protein YeaQ/YmgE (transglycosylase-associated protein family)
MPWYPAAMLWFILVMVIFGFIAGAIARALVPGDDGMGILGTIVLGLAGSFVGGFLFNALFVKGDQDGIQPVGLLGAIIGSVVLLLLFRWAGNGSTRRRVS